MLSTTQYDELLRAIPPNERSFFFPAMIIESRSNVNASVVNANEESYGLWQINVRVWQAFRDTNFQSITDQAKAARQIASVMIAQNPGKDTSRDEILYHLWRGWASNTAEDEFLYVSKLWDGDYTYDKYVSVYQATANVPNSQFLVKRADNNSKKEGYNMAEKNKEQQNADSSGVKIHELDSENQIPTVDPQKEGKEGSSWFMKVKTKAVQLYNQVKDRLAKEFRDHKPAFIIVTAVVAVIILFKIDNPLTRKLLSLADEYLEEGVKSDGILGAFWRLLARILKMISNKRVFAECAPKTASVLEAYSRGVQTFAGGGGSRAFAFDF